MYNFFFRSLTPNKHKQIKKISFYTNNIINKKINFKNNFFLTKFNLNNLLKFTFFLENILNRNLNILLVDYNYNYNYLPISNALIFNRSVKTLNKLIKYFNIVSIIYFDINKKTFIFKKLTRLKLVNISVTNTTLVKNFDFSLNVKNNSINNYLIYIHVMNIYNKIKNKIKI